MSEEEAVRNANKEWGASVNAGDVDDLINRAAADVAFMPPGEPAVVGSGALGEYCRAMMDHVSIQVTITDESVHVGGDVGCLFGSATIAAIPKQGGDPMEDVIKWTHVFRRQPDGAWKMAVNIWNSDNPPPAH